MKWQSSWKSPNDTICTFLMCLWRKYLCTYWNLLEITPPSSQGSVAHRLESYSASLNFHLQRKIKPRIIWSLGHLFWGSGCQVIRKAFQLLNNYHIFLILQFARNCYLLEEQGDHKCKTQALVGNPARHTYSIKQMHLWGGPKDQHWKYCNRGHVKPSLLTWKSREDSLETLREQSSNVISIFFTYW